MQESLVTWMREGILGDTQNEQTMVVWINNLGDGAHTLTNDLPTMFGACVLPQMTHRDMQGGG